MKAFRAMTLAAIATLACSDDSTSPATPGQSDTTAVVQVITADLVAGDGQQGTVGRPLPSPLVVRVFVNGVPRAGIDVRWYSPSGQLSSSPSDGSGYARAVWTLGGRTGVHQATASLMTGSGRAVATEVFTATALPGPTSRIELVGAATGSAPANSAYGFGGYSPSVRPFDAFGNPSTDAAVIWSIVDGPVTGASWLLGRPLAANANGVVSMGFMPTGEPGVAHVRASLADTSIRVDFQLTLSPAEYVVRIADPSYDGIPLFVSQQNRSGEFPGVMAVDTIPVGATFRWVSRFWATMPPQRIVPLDTDAFPASPPLANGESYEVTFNTPGTYRYGNGTTPDVPAGIVVVR